MAESSQPDLDLLLQLDQIAALGQAGQLTEAARRCDLLLAKHPNAPVWNLRSLISLQQGEGQQALLQIQRAIALAPEAAFYAQAGVIYCSLGDLETGIQRYQQALSRQPNLHHTRFNLGLALQKQGNLTKAEQSYLVLLSDCPDYAPAYLQLGNLTQQQSRLMAAIDYYRQAIRLAPGAAAWCNLGVALQAVGEVQQAETAFGQAIALQPNYLEAQNGLGAVYEKQERAQAAIQAYQQALAIQPDYLPALSNLGNLYLRLEQFDAAEATYQQILRQQPEHLPTLDGYVKLLRLTCDWTKLSEQTAALQTGIRAGLAQGKLLSVSPLNSLFLPWSASEQQAIARSHAEAIERRVGELEPASARPTKPRIRLGYVSGDFRYHAVGQLILRLFEQHDRQSFEVFAYAFGPDDGSLERQKLIADCDCFRVVAGQPPAAVAAQVQQDQIDILIDLAGYTNYACPELFALRPAPVQVSYLGYPASLGASYIDYAITDAVITPPELIDSLSEAPLFLPDSYQLNCYPYPFGADLPSPDLRQIRAESGLPPDAFVFCCFNHSQKLEPIAFAVWMRLLQQIPQSVLWLLSERPEVEANLRQQAVGHSIDPNRLIFAPRVPKAAHLHRHTAADLFLDTLYYNAHVTASDALWAGTPLVTVLGETFASRVAASLLTAAGLPELIAADLAEYEHLTLHLARHPAALQQLKDRLLANRASAPLFDSARTVRQLEAGYRLIWQRAEAGLAPEVMRVERLLDASANPIAKVLDTQPDTPTADEGITCRTDAGFLDWMRQANGSLLITTYQANKLLLVGWNGQQVTLLARDFPKPMGLAVSGSQLALATRHQLLLFANAPALASSYLEHQPNRYDGLYLPRAAHFTGDLHTHDLAFGRDGLWLVNTRFSCLAHLSPEFNFLPRWHPAFISALVPEDRCHLNGLAMMAGKPKYVTALGESDQVGGWRANKASGGILIELESDQIVLRGLSMPHSPRWHQDRLWLLNSGQGELLCVDPDNWTAEVVCRLPGFGRGLTLVDHYALIGLSQTRSTQLFDGLPIQSREPLVCGVLVVDLRRGEPIGLLEFPTGCRELYEVAYLPRLRRPNLLCPDQAIDAFVAPDLAYWLRPSALIGTALDQI